MSDSGSQEEPTMEEILASIRKIISEDDPEGQESKGQESEETQMPEEGVLELTERVEQAAAQADQGSSEEQEIDAILASVIEEDGPRQGGDSGGLVAPNTDSAVTSTLAGFAGALMKEKGDGEGGSGPGQTLDTLVRAVLEPYLKTWLDENLEPLVERVVREELKRMARRAEDL